MPLYTQGDYSPNNPPPDDADPLALTSFNPLTFMRGGAAFSSAISAGTTRVAYNDARLTYGGATEWAVGATAPDNVLYQPGSLYPHTYGAQWNASVDFFTDAPWFEVQTKYVADQAFRLLVDGRRVTEKAVTTASAGVAANASLNLRFDFGNTNPKRITLQMAGFPFNGVFIPTASTLWKVPAYTERTLVLSESLTGGSTFNTGWGIGTWLNRVALLMGWEDVWNQSLGGTGYTIVGPYTTFGARATGTVTGSTGGLNDIGQYGLTGGTTRIIVWGGINDTTSTQTAINTAARALYQNIKAAVPAASLYVIGCHSTSGTPTQVIIDTDETLRLAAASAGAPFVSPVTGRVYNGRGTLISDQGPWFSASNQLFIAPDGVHATDDGYAYIARRIASAFHAIQADDSTIAPWAGGLHVAIEDGAPTGDKELNYLFGPGTVTTMTPTALTTTTARCWSYNSQFRIVVNRLRWFGIGATTTHRLAVYRLSDGVQVIGPISLTTTADAWNSATVPAVTLAANTPYIVALSTTATGTTAGLRTSATPAVGPPLQATTPGGLALAGGDHRFWFAQFAVTAGVLPATLPTLVRATGWTGGIPLFFFDSNSAA